MGPGNDIGVSYVWGLRAANEDRYDMYCFEHYEWAARLINMETKWLLLHWPLLPSHQLRQPACSFRLEVQEVQARILLAMEEKELLQYLTTTDWSDHVE